jgi:hypothetical protein
MASSSSPHHNRHSHPPQVNAGTLTRWLSPSTQNNTRLLRLQHTAAHIHVYRSPYFPKTVPDFLLHEREYDLDLAIKTKTKLERKIEALESKKKLAEMLVVGMEGGIGMGGGGEGVAKNGPLMKLAQGLGNIQPSFGGKGGSWDFEEKGEPLTEQSTHLEVGSLPYESKRKEREEISDTREEGRNNDAKAKSKQETNPQTEPFPSVDIPTLPQPSPVLCLTTSIWHPSHPLLPQGPRDSLHRSRAYWPSPNEYKMSGDDRLHNHHLPRRLPLPRKDFYNADWLRYYHDVGDIPMEVLVEMTGDGTNGISWNERKVVQFEGLDGLQCVERERNAPGEKGTVPPGARPDGEVWDERRNRMQRPEVGREVVQRYGHWTEAPSEGVDGPGEGNMPLFYGWEFDENWLAQRGEWKSLLEETQ